MSHSILTLRFLPLHQPTPVVSSNNRIHTPALTLRGVFTVSVIIFSSIPRSSQHNQRKPRIPPPRRSNSRAPRRDLRDSRLHHRRTCVGVVAADIAAGIAVGVGIA